jgi:hypothetical protein
MRRRSRPSPLLLGAGLLFGLQLGLALYLGQLPLPPDGWMHPPLPSPFLMPEGPAAAPDPDRVAVEALDALLHRRVERAALARQLPAPQPSAALRAAALNSPDPNGPAVQALIAAYAESLAGLGEGLDAVAPPPPLPPP